MGFQWSLLGSLSSYGNLLGGIFQAYSNFGRPLYANGSLQAHRASDWCMNMLHHWPSSCSDASYCSCSAIGLPRLVMLYPSCNTSSTALQKSHDLVWQDKGQHTGVAHLTPCHA